MTAYSTPAAPVTSGQALIFDRTSTQEGTAISHANNSADFNIDEPGTYVAIYHTVDNPDLKGTDYVTGAVIEKEALGKTFWYSTLGAESLPLYDGACYRLVTETY